MNKTFENQFLKIDLILYFLTLLEFYTVIHGIISALLLAILWLSNETIAENIVIWSKKSIRTAIAAIIQKETNAGILQSIPTKNANT